MDGIYYPNLNFLLDLSNSPPKIATTVCFLFTGPEHEQTQRLESFDKKIYVYMNWLIKAWLIKLRR